jgi:hypothetical protein
VVAGVLTEEQAALYRVLIPDGPPSDEDVAAFRSLRRVALGLAIGYLLCLAISATVTARGVHQPSVRIGRQMAAHRGWTGYEWRSLYWLWDRESGWSPWARNRSSGACGIPQAISCPFGLGFIHARTQIRWGIRYISGRYGKPSRAWAHSQSYGWY